MHGPYFYMTVTSWKLLMNLKKCEEQIITLESQIHDSSALLVQPLCWQKNSIFITTHSDESKNKNINSSYLIY